MDALCLQALNTAIELLPASLGVLALANRDGAFVPRCVAGVAENEDGLVLSAELVREVASGPSPILVTATAEDTRTTDFVRRGMRSVVVLSLHHSGEALGMIYLGSKVSAEELSEKGLRCCDLIAGQLSAELQCVRVAMALEEARRKVEMAQGSP